VKRGDIQAAIIAKDHEREAAEAARVAAIGTNFNPLDPALNDVLRVPSPPSQALKEGRFRCRCTAFMLT
jgi:hypothetical protein